MAASGRHLVDSVRQAGRVANLEMEAVVE